MRYANRARTSGPTDATRAVHTQRTTRAVKSAPMQSGLVAMHGMAEPGWTKPNYQALSNEGFMKNPVVHRCVRMIAEAAASVPWTAFEGPTEHPGHHALNLLARPNQRETGRQFLETVYGHLLLAGNAYIERISASAQLTQLFALRPDRITVECDDDGWPSQYTYDVGSRKKHIAIGDALDGPSPVLHLSQFHPLDDHYGFAPLHAALMALDIHNAAGRWNKALLDNAARPSGALVYAPEDQTNLTDEQFDRLKRELEDGYSGALNAGRPLILEGGMDWRAMGLTPRDMDFIEAKNAASRDIALAFGVPPMLLGIPGDNTYANYAEANRAFYRLTVIPLASRVAEAFAAWLSSPTGERLRFECDLDGVPGLAVEREALWSRLENAGFLTDAEKREAVGYGPRADEKIFNRNES